jgi:hypothetical protein
MKHGHSPEVNDRVQDVREEGCESICIQGGASNRKKGPSVYKELISAVHQALLFRMIKSKRVRWSRYVAHTTESDRSTQLRKHSGNRGWEESSRADIEAIGCIDTKWIYRAQNRVYGRLLCTR